MLSRISWWCLFICCMHVTLSTNEVGGKYKPTWDSLDKRPLPKWFDQAKFGIFIHWGVFSVPSYLSEWFWWQWQGYEPTKPAVEFMKNNYPPNFTYEEFASSFTAEFWNPDKWADLFAASGAKYIVLTAKHHEGFTLWPSSVSWNWNAVDTGPKRDLVGDLAKSIRNRTDLHFGIYHSLMDWFHPLYLKDKTTLFLNSTFPQQKSIPELHELVNAYEPDVIWSDGDWEAPAEYWTSQEFLAWLYNDSPVKDTVVVNDRWGLLSACHHGGYYTCSDKYNPGVLQPHKWENCMTIDLKSWGYRRNADLADYINIEDLIATLASTVSCGGNLLVNVGPTKEGTITSVFEERLRQMGSWLKVNGEAIYSSVPWKYQNDTVTPNIWYTSDGDDAVYAIVLKWPTAQALFLGAPTATKETKVSMLGLDHHENLSWQPILSGLSGITVQFPILNSPNKLPWAWVLKMENLK